MKKTGLAILVSGLVSISVLFADGDSRPATQKEKDFSLDVMHVLDAAIPAVPSGWALEEKTEMIAPDRVTPGAEKYPFKVEYQQSWQHPGRLEEARLKEEQMIIEMAASMQKDQKGLDEMTGKLNALSAELAKAFEKNDAAEVSRIQSQMQELGDQLNAYGESQNKTLEARQQEIKAKDTRIRFSYRVNATQFDISRYSKEEDVAGFQVYRREFDDPNASIEGEFVVFAGNFSPKKYEFETWMELTIDPAVPSTSVQSIILVVAGDKAHTRQRLESIDWNSLKIMLK